MYTASTLAATSIAAALQGLGWCSRANIPMQDLLKILHDLTGVEQDLLHECLDQVEQMFLNAARSQNAPNDQGGEVRRGTTWMQTHNTPYKEWKKAGTPTDVRDVHF